MHLDSSGVIYVEAWIMAVTGLIALVYLFADSFPHKFGLPKRTETEFRLSEVFFHLFDLFSRLYKIFTGDPERERRILDIPRAISTSLIEWSKESAHSPPFLCFVVGGVTYVITITCFIYLLLVDDGSSSWLTLPLIVSFALFLGGDIAESVRQNKQASLEDQSVEQHLEQSNEGRDDEPQNKSEDEVVQD